MTAQRSRIVESHYRVPYADTDQMGVVYYANYLIYFERIRNEMLRDLGITYREFEERGYQLPVLESHCFYRHSAQYDDWLTFRGWFEQISPIRLQAHCEVYRDEQLLADGYTLHVAFDPQKGRPCKLPAFLSDAITQASAS